MIELLCTVFQDTIGKGKDNKARFRALNWIFLILLFIIIVAIVVSSISSVSFYESYRGWYYIVGATFFFAAFSGPAYRVAKDERDRGVVTVLFWGLLGMVIFLATFVSVFFASDPAITGHSASASIDSLDYSRLLNVVPAVIAVWIAGLGWYTHHQIVMKGHRTTHAFNLLMETQTNPEYIRNLRAFQLVYPPSRIIEEAIAKKYYAEGLTGLPALRRVCEHQSSTPAAKEEAQNTITRLEAVHAAKYLLNYFEFMARAISSGDLDEFILYDTIGPTVVRIFHRTANFRNQYKEDQPLAMQFIAPLVDEWERRTRQEIANLA